MRDLECLLLAPFAHLELGSDLGRQLHSNSEVQAGWTAGGGFQYTLNNKVSLKGEYLFVDLGSESITARGNGTVFGQTTTPEAVLGINIDTELHIARMGLNLQLD